MRLLAFVPAQSASISVPDKNITLLHGVMLAASKPVRMPENAPVKILVGYQPDDYPDVKAFSALGDCAFHRYDEAFLRHHLHEYDMLVTHLEVPVTADILRAAPNCRLVATPTTGIDHVDLDACRLHGITVCSLNDDPAFLERITSTAELAWLLILASARRLAQATERVKQQSWWNSDLRGWQLYGLHAGNYRLRPNRPHG